MRYFLLTLSVWLLSAPTAFAHCGKPHHGKLAKPSAPIAAPQDSADERDAA